MVPTVVQIRSFPFGNIDLWKSHSVIDEAVSLLKNCERKPFISFIPMDDCIFFVISTVLTIIFSFLATRIKQNPTESHSSSRRRTRTSRLNEYDSSGTNQREASNGEPQTRERIPLLPRQPANATAQPSDRTAQPSDRTAQPSDRTAQPSDEIVLSSSTFPAGESNFPYDIRLSLHKKLIF